ncbi:MAG: SpoIIE family protein phosphatase [Deltaproteobacteria bacterium]|nr:SpoIIE family protein phosphatase [Deltaproteobacteria bacterium]
MSIARHPVKRRGLAFKLSLMILTGTAVIFTAAFGYNYIYSRNQILKNVETNAQNLTLAAVNRIETVLRGVEKDPSYLAHALSEKKFDHQTLLGRVEALLNTNPDIFGSAVAFDPYAFDPESLYFAPYYYRDGISLKLKLIYLGNKLYQYFFWDWYQIPKELERAVWSEPYFDEGAGNIIMSTYSIPFSRINGKKRVFTGIVTADISLDWLVDIVSRLSPYGSGYAFLISQSGVFVTHPDREAIMRESIFSVAEAANDRELRETGRAMIRGETGFVALKKHFSGQKAIIGTAGFGILFLVIVLISGTITRPLRTLAGKAAEIARGNLDIEVTEVKSNDEIGELSRSFDNMKVALKEYIANLAETTAAKERYESELKIARTIQMSFLPKNFPPFPENVEFDIYATLDSAKEVGGDLYDFFLLDEDHLFFSIGDVSGKGVPAALFMAATKTLMKGTAGRDMAPSEVLSRVNRELCLGNDSMMFVTVFCGILNFRTGEVLYSNAGHNPPLILRAGQPPEWLTLPDGFFLGTMEDSVYETRQILLAPGDMLLLYTDGVTEAMNGDKFFYEERRLIRVTEDHGHEPPENLVREILRSVRDFAGSEPQSDDITMLALSFRRRAENPS